MIAATHILQCMEIWNGNRSIENSVSGPGMEAWVFSQPYHGESHGGDVHYLTLCAGGIVTRIALADVAGHGTCVAETSQILKSLLRRFMNSKGQNALTSALNREFTALEQCGRFATAVIATFQSHKRRLLITNAGHPRPFLFRQSIGAWQILCESASDVDQGGNLPLGIDDTTSYEHFDIPIAADDWLLLYTDALTEAENSEGKMLGEAGLLKLIGEIPTTGDSRTFGKALRDKLNNTMNDLTQADDLTLIVMRFLQQRRRPRFIERLRGYGEIVKNCFSRREVQP